MTNFVILAIQTFYVTNSTPKSVEIPYCQICEYRMAYNLDYSQYVMNGHPHLNKTIKTNYTVLITTNINITYLQNGITNFTVIKQ